MNEEEKEKALRGLRALAKLPPWIRRKMINDEAIRRGLMASHCEPKQKVEVAPANETLIQFLNRQPAGSKITRIYFKNAKDNS